MQEKQCAVNQAISETFSFETFENFTEAAEITITRSSPKRETSTDSQMRFN